MEGQLSGRMLAILQKRNVVQPRHQIHQIQTRRNVRRKERSRENTKTSTANIRRSRPGESRLDQMDFISGTMAHIIKSMYIIHETNDETLLADCEHTNYV